MSSLMDVYSFRHSKLKYPHAFIAGRCGEFAAGLNRVLGYAPAIFLATKANKRQSIIHAVGINPKNRLSYDYLGAHNSFGQLMSIQTGHPELGNFVVELKVYPTEKEFWDAVKKYRWYPDQDALQKAVTYIQKHRDEYR